MFGYVILIRMDFFRFYSPRQTQPLAVWPRFQASPGSTKLTPLRVVLLTHFSMFGNEVKHDLSC